MSGAPSHRRAPARLRAHSRSDLVDGHERIAARVHCAAALEGGLELVDDSVAPLTDRPPPDGREASTSVPAKLCGCPEPERRSRGHVVAEIPNPECFAQRRKISSVM